MEAITLTKEIKELEQLEKKIEELEEREEELEEELEELEEEIEEQEEEQEEEIEDPFFRELELLIGGESVLIVTESAQLNLLGQTFRPIFCGPIIEVENGHLTLFPVTIKIFNAPFFQFPTPLSIPLEKIAHLTTDFDCDDRFPLI